MTFYDYLVKSGCEHSEPLVRGEDRAVVTLDDPRKLNVLSAALVQQLRGARAQIVPAFGRLGLLPEVGTSWALTRRLGDQGAFAYYAGIRRAFVLHDRCVPGLGPAAARRSRRQHDPCRPRRARNFAHRVSFLMA